MSAQIFESVTHFVIGTYDVRIWRSEDEPGIVTCQDLLAYKDEALNRLVEEAFLKSPDEILKELAAFPNVSAVEVTAFHFSMLIYNDWP